MEKKLFALTIHVTEGQLRDIQDAAMFSDRKVSDWVRHIVCLHLYGIKRTHDEQEDNENRRCE